MERWEGKIAIVTGATGGIGGGIARGLAEKGLTVIGIDVNEPSELKVSVGKGRILFMKCDIRNNDDLKAMFDLVEKDYSGVDIMVNCAGYAKVGHITSAGDNPIPEEDLIKTIDVNVKALILCSRYAVNSMKKRGVNGHIVNINSIAGHYVAFSDNFNVYSSTKYAVTAFTESLQRELAVFKNHIRVTSISPGLVQTPLSGAFNVDFTVSLQPADIADAVIYAVSRPPHVNISEITVQPTAEIKK